MAGDEVVVTKAGKRTYGLERFFSSLYGKSVSGLSFTERRVSPPGKSAPKDRGGRPKASQTQNKTQVRLIPELLRIQGWIQGLLKQLGTVVPVTYFMVNLSHSGKT